MPLEVQTPLNSFDVTNSAFPGYLWVAKLKQFFTSRATKCEWNSHEHMPMPLQISPTTRCGTTHLLVLLLKANRENKKDETLVENPTSPFQTTEISQHESITNGYA